MNPIRTILVHFDASPASAARLQLARDLAERHGSLVTALYAVTPSVLQTTFAGDSTAATMPQQPGNGQLQRAKTSFQAAMVRAGPAVTWTELQDPSLIAGFAGEALYADLLVLGGRPSNEAPSADVPADFAQAVMFASGKPAIVVPQSAKRPSAGRRVVVAWKSCREAARSVAFALPLLQRADRVHLAHWSESGAKSYMPLGIQRYLRMHDIEPMCHDCDPPRGHVGEAMRAFAADVGADLLVMGCYGHSRIRELVLGGATRDVLHAMTLPVFMVH